MTDNQPDHKNTVFYDHPCDILGCTKGRRQKKRIFYGQAHCNIDTQNTFYLIVRGLKNAISMCIREAVIYVLADFVR